VPYLGQRRHGRQRLPPGAVTAGRVVDRQQAAAPRRLRHPAVRRFAEVDPADVAERVGVAVGGRHLLPWQQREAVARAGRGQELVVAHRVVVGDGQEVQAVGRRQRGQFVDAQRAVGVRGVRMQVTGQPAQPVGARQHAPGPSFGHGDRDGRRHLDCLGRHRKLVVDAGRSQPMQSDDHLPLPRRQPAVDVPGGGRRRPDQHLLAGAAGPAPPARRIDQTEIQDAGRVIEGEVDAQAGAAGRYLEVHVMPHRRRPVLGRPPAALRAKCRHEPISSPSSPR
jgi:hypothetical protein